MTVVFGGLVAVAAAAGYAGLVWWRLCALTRMWGPHQEDRP